VYDKNNKIDMIDKFKYHMHWNIYGWLGMSTEGLCVELLLSQKNSTIHVLMIYVNA